MRVEPFKPEHLCQMQIQPAQRSWEQYGTMEYAKSIAADTAYSFWIGDELIACAGVLTASSIEGHAWCFLSVNARRHLLALHRTVLRMLRVAGKRFVFASSEDDFQEGCRWLEMLGFTFDRMLPQFGPDGRTHKLYRREF